MTYHRIAAVAAVLVLSSGSVARGRSLPLVEVTECGQVVERAIGVMTHDLDCSSFDGNALTLNKATLEMRGFTITGNSAPGLDPSHNPRHVILCLNSNPGRASGWCRITGPGLVTNGSTSDPRRAPLDCQGQGAIYASALRLSIVGVTVSGNLGAGIEGGTRTRIENSVITDNGRAGICKDGYLNVRNSLIARNGSRGLFGLNGCCSATIMDSKVLDNVAQGVMLESVPKGVRLIRTAVTGNASSQEACDAGFVPPVGCADIVKSRDPRNGPLRADTVTCGTSADRETGEPLGICSDD